MPAPRRARWPTLLRAEELEALAGRDLDGLLAALSEVPPYRRDVEAALARTHGLPAALWAVRAHLTRTLGELRTLYEAQARELVDLALAGWDLHNLIALLRGAAAGRPAGETLAHVVAIGRFDEATAASIAGQPDAGHAAALLSAWRLPDAQTARALHAAWADYERTADLAALEHAVAAAQLARRAEAARAAGADAAPLRELIAWEVDARNVLVVLRLREALAAGELRELPPLEGRSSPLLPGGCASPAGLEAAVRHPDPAQVAIALARAAQAPGLPRALARWREGAALPAVERELDLARERALLREARHGDPLGLAVPLGWSAAKGLEARNLRLLATSTARELDPDARRSQLLLP